MRWNQELNACTPENPTCSAICWILLVKEDAAAAIPIIQVGTCEAFHPIDISNANMESVRRQHHVTLEFGNLFERRFNDTSYIRLFLYSKC